MSATQRKRSTFATGLGTILVAVLVPAGCGAQGTATPAKAGAPAPALAERPAGPEVVEARALRDAQMAWCSYLQALYLRAQQGAARWPKFEECSRVRTTASPRMLQQTADCSMRALQHHEGDPFTTEYAAEVSRCGTEALDSMSVTRSEIAPIVASICGRAASCGEISYTECRQGLEEGLGPRLERAIGAINTRARNELRACLLHTTCSDVATQITSCLEPVLERMLWLPG